MGTNKSIGLAGPIKISRGCGAQSAVANAPVSPVYTDPVRLGGMVIKVNIDAREIMPLRVETYGRRGAPPVVGTALATAKALLASGLLVGLIKPPFQHPRYWGLEPMAEKRKRGGGRKAIAWRGLAHGADIPQQQGE